METRLFTDSTVDRLDIPFRVDFSFRQTVCSLCNLMVEYAQEVNISVSRFEYMIFSMPG